MIPDSDQVLALCARVFPGEGQLAVNGIQPLSSGWECDVYSFRLTSRLDGRLLRRDLVLRLYAFAPHSVIADKHVREYSVMKCLAAAGYPVPQVMGVDHGTVAGRPAMIMERVAGSPLGSGWAKKSSVERSAILSLFCHLHLRLHELDWRPLASELNLTIEANPVAQQLRLLRSYLEKLGSSDFDLGMRWLDTMSHSVTVMEPSIIHWDYHLDNVLLSDDGTPYVIDWTAAEITDYRFDLAWSLMLAGRDQDLVLAEYERLAGHGIPDLEFFRAFAYLRRLVVMTLSMQAGADKFGLKAGLEEQMRKNLAPMRRIYEAWRTITHVQIPVVEQLLDQFCRPMP